MVPLYTGAVLVLLTDGLHSVSNWLKAIEKYRGTFISAPDIAYRLCVKSVRDPRDYDLSSLRVALNASEPVRGETYKMFEGTFNLKNVMISGYGLAEATVAVTMHPPGEPFVTDKNGYVSSGRPLKGISIRIDTSENRPGKMNTGEILVKSEALMKGYFNMPLSRELFDNEVFLRTGDIGYLDGNDNLFVLSRKKIIIIQGGITLYPDDVEQVVMETGNINQSFAIGLEPKPGTGEHLFVFAEYVHSKCADIETCHQLTVQIVKRIYDHFGLRPAGIYLLKPKSLPKTPNGKKQYFRLRSEFINRSPGLMSRILYPEIK